MARHARGTSRCRPGVGGRPRAGARGRTGRLSGRSAARTRPAPLRAFCGVVVRAIRRTSRDGRSLLCRAGPRCRSLVRERLRAVSATFRRCPASPGRRHVRGGTGCRARAAPRFSLPRSPAAPPDAAHHDRLGAQRTPPSRATGRATGVPRRRDGSPLRGLRSSRLRARRSPTPHPDVLVCLLEHGRNWDVEVVDDLLLVASTRFRRGRDATEVPALLRFATLLGAEVRTQVVPYTDPRAVFPRTQVAAAGRRLRRRSVWCDIAILLGLVVGVPAAIIGGVLLVAR